MICTECQANNLKSFVYPSGQTVTAMYCQPYYDENGVYHHHDMNTFRTQYNCSNGHSWSEATTGSCPTPSCNWGKTTV